MSNLFLMIAFLSLTSYAQDNSVHLPTVFNCLLQTRNATNSAVNADALLVKGGSSSYLINAAKILKITKPKPEQLPEGDVNLMTDGTTARYASLRNGAVQFYVGEKKQLPEVHISATSLNSSELGVLLAKEIMSQVARNPKAADYARIYSACKKIPKLDLPEDWAEHKVPKEHQKSDDEFWGSPTGK